MISITRINNIFLNIWSREKKKAAMVILKFGMTHILNLHPLV